jgi:tRNA threonylcarbamoyladenosine biosynthesis protein TsaB
MILLTIRTDKPESELGLYDGNKQLAYKTWEAHRQLAETLHLEIAKILQSQGLEISNIQAVVVYKGPGSFTGLRIGMSVANALAYSMQVPIVAESGEWIEQGIKRLNKGQSDKVAIPNYGEPARTTTQKK